MSKRSLESRRQVHSELSSSLAGMSDRQLLSLIEPGESSGGWGKHNTVELVGSQVFIKRVPVTGIELANLYSTKNLYNLPTFYNYGVGSAGLGVFRELAANLKTTQWALNGSCSHFPLMFHHRILPRRDKHQSTDLEEHAKYVKYWASNENIGRYMLDRANASHELWLFMEHVPFVLQPWLKAHPSQIHRVLEELRTTTAFLLDNGILHFDAHFHNVVTDGEEVYLTDFGLVLDKSFDLSPEERSFFDANTQHDSAEILTSLGLIVYHAYEDLPEIDRKPITEKYGLSESLPFHERSRNLLNHIEEICSVGLLKLHPDLLALAIQYRDIISLTRDFFSAMQSGDEKDAVFPNEDLKRMLTKSGFV